MKKVLYLIVGLFLIYIAYLYLTGKRETFLILEGYEGPLLIIANQKDGIEIDRRNAVYDFTQGNVIKIKGDLVTGFSPWGYLNYYKVSPSGERKKLKTINDPEENQEVNKDDIYVINHLFEIGGCNGTNYESLLISSPDRIDENLKEKRQQVNTLVCNKAP